MEFGLGSSERTLQLSTLQCTHSSTAWRPATTESLSPPQLSLRKKTLTHNNEIVLFPLQLQREQKLFFPSAVSENCLVHLPFPLNEQVNSDCIANALWWVLWFMVFEIEHHCYLLDGERGDRKDHKGTGAVE